MNLPRGGGDCAPPFNNGDVALVVKAAVSSSASPDCEDSISSADDSDVLLEGVVVLGMWILSVPM